MLVIKGCPKPYRLKSIMSGTAYAIGIVHFTATIHRTFLPQVEYAFLQCSVDRCDVTSCDDCNKHVSIKLEVIHENFTMAAERGSSFEADAKVRRRVRPEDLMRL
jgi:hypothetical protein